MANSRFFTNTYITGSGRQNYLNPNYYLEDPLFTSFTFDIDFSTSPLFYTINNSDYGYPSSEGLGDNIEVALSEMHANNMGGGDNGYDILPAMTADVLNGNKLGFGLQQNIYMDLPLYGATEYIYMVDKRNGGASQNDVRFNEDSYVDGSGSSNEANSYKLGNSITEIVNESDRVWANARMEEQKALVEECDNILKEGGDPAKEHEKNKSALSQAEEDIGIKEMVKETQVGSDGKETEVVVEYTEEQLVSKIKEYKKFNDDFENFKTKIIRWANGKLTGYKNQGIKIYTNNPCVKKIFSYSSEEIKNKKQDIVDCLKKEYGDNFVDVYLFGNGEKSYIYNFRKLYNSIIRYDYNPSISGAIQNGDSGSSQTFLLDKKAGDNKSSIRDEKILDEFKSDLEQFDLYDAKTKSLNGSIRAVLSADLPEWVNKFVNLTHFADNSNLYDGVETMIKEIMRYQCDADTSIDTEFTSDKIKKNKEQLALYENALNNIRYSLYGERDGEVCDKDNPKPDSIYGQYLAAKDKYENDDYSQAQKTRDMALSGQSEIASILDSPYTSGESPNDGYNDNGIPTNNVQESGGGTKSYSNNAPQTVLDMIGFVCGMRKMITQYPYILQGVTGLDTAYNKHYGIKDPYLGSGDDKITLTCLESLDLRVSSMFNRYFNAVYDRQYRRERVPINLRRFNCSIYVHDVRNFVAVNNQNPTNRIIELANMYHSVIEFRFYDCEIVPEETGNIFNDISNESPSEMKKTNFTFTYGNCVVNFVPATQVAGR